MEESSGSVYRPLSRGRSLRLIELLPAQNNEAIRIRFRIHDVGPDPEYEAISYTWGRPELRHTIYCNGSPLGVTENLYNLLLMLRKRLPRSLLWIDAISIDQKSVEEKAHIVPLMPEIYRQARRVLCWVGSDVSDPVRRLIGSLHQFRYEVAHGRSIVSDPDFYHSENKMSAAILDRFRSDSRFSDAKAWQGLDEFLSLTYFQR